MIDRSPKCKKKSNGIVSFKQLFQETGIFSVSLDYIVDQDNLLIKTTGHAVMVNGCGKYAQDGPFKSGCKTDELLHDQADKDTRRELSEEEVDEKVKKELKYFGLRHVCQWFASEKAVIAGKVPQFLGTINPHCCTNCKESKFECHGKK